LKDRVCEGDIHRLIVWFAEHLAISETVDPDPFDDLLARLYLRTLNIQWPSTV
jgi:hypothetical protein